MSTRFITGAVGGVIGFFIGGPNGAAYGWAIGSTIGGIADPETIKAPGVGDLANQTSQEGGPRPIVFALSPPMAGNVIASGPARKIKKKKRQGKGGPKVEYETVLRTYAIGICEGPIERVLRVWRNGELVYNSQTVDELNVYDGHGFFHTVVEAVLRMQSNNAKFMEKATFYMGTYDQNADPALESIFGVGQTAAHRGTAYMVIEDDDLTDFRGAIPQYMFQVSMTPLGDPVIVYLEDDTWVKPFGLKDATVTVIGGGGGGSSGGGGPSYGTIGSGGSGGGFARAKYLAADLLDTMAIEVGEGGVGGPPNISTSGGNGGDVGGDGGDSKFGTFMTATGGTGGIPYTGSGSSATTGGVGTVAGGHNATDIVTANGGISYKESNNLPTGSTYGGGAGGSGSSPTGQSGGPQQAGGTVSNANGYEFVGGAGGDAGTGVVSPVLEGPGTPGEDGHAWGGGGGAGGNGKEELGGPDDHFFSGAGGNGYQGVVVVEQTFEDSYTGLPEVVLAICNRAGLPASKVDVSQLEGNVRGFSVTNAYPALEALRSLSQIFLFDPTTYDGKVVFIHRGENTVATITEDDLVDDDQEIEHDKRGDSIQIPRVMNLNYYDIAGNLNTDKQTSERAGDRRVQGEMQLQTPIILNANEAKRVVTINHKVYIEDQKGEIQFCLPDNFIFLVPTDAIFFQRDGKTERLRVTRADTQDGYQEYTLLRDRQSAYTSNVEGYPAAPSQIPASNVVGPTLIEPLDIPILFDVDDGLGLSLYIAISGVSEAWNGATIEISYDGGANYQDSRDSTLPITMGVLETALPDHPRDFPDATNSVQVRILTPDSELETTDLAGMLSKVNRAIVGDEIIQFANAEELEPGLWELSYLLRGRRDTETSVHAAGERFVMLDALTAIPASLTDLGRTLTFRATSFGTDASTGTVVSLVYQGKSQTEFAPGYVSARRDGTDAIVTWMGRGRLGGGGNVAHGARFAGYRVTFDDGVNPIVTVDTMSETLTQDVAALGTPITISVMQLNDLTGEGPAVEVILT